MPRSRRRKTLDGWENREYYFSAEYDCEIWKITFTVEDADPDCSDDIQTIGLPGWYSPDHVADVIQQVNDATNQCCTNCNSQMYVDLRKVHRDSTGLLEKIVALVQHVQGKVDCIS